MRGINIIGESWGCDSVQNALSTPKLWCTPDGSYTAESGRAGRRGELGAAWIIGAAAETGVRGCVRWWGDGDRWLLPCEVGEGKFGVVGDGPGERYAGMRGDEPPMLRCVS